MALVLVLVSMVALGPGAATAAPSAKVATLTVYADASALAENGWTAETLQSGHAFISVKNISTSPITVGGLTKVQPQQVVTVGTWGNREEHVGVWYNLESYYIHKNLSAYATGSLSRDITSSELRSLNNFIIANDSHGGKEAGAILNNCSTFAMNAWNLNIAFGPRVSAGIPNTPTGLFASISSYPDYKSGESVNIPWHSIGVWYANGKKVTRSTVYAEAATKLTFSEFAVGTAITDQYQSKGILFSGTPGPFISQDGSNPTSPVLSPGAGFTGTLEFTFVSTTDPSRGSGASAVAFDIGYMDDIGGAKISWYSANGKLLGSKATDSYGIQRISIPGIVRKVVVETATDSAGAAIDNLEFDHL